MRGPCIRKRGPRSRRESGRKQQVNAGGIVRSVLISSNRKESGVACRSATYKKKQSAPCPQWAEHPIIHVGRPLISSFFLPVSRLPFFPNPYLLSSLGNHPAFPPHLLRHIPLRVFASSVPTARMYFFTCVCSAGGGVAGGRRRREEEVEGPPK